LDDEHILFSDRLGNGNAGLAVGELFNNTRNERYAKPGEGLNHEFVDLIKAELERRLTAQPLQGRARGDYSLKNKRLVSSPTDEE
jgi:hypothetical protein